MDLRKNFRKGLIWRIVNGKTVSFWTDQWLLEKPIMTIFPPGYGVEQEEKVEKYITRSRTWNIPLLNTVLWHDLVEKVKGVFIPKISIPDRLYWRKSKNG